MVTFACGKLSFTVVAGPDNQQRQALSACLEPTQESKSEQILNKWGFMVTTGENRHAGTV